MSVSGKAGTATGGGTALVDLTKWTFEPVAAISKFNSNSSGGTKTGVAGPKDSKGSLECKLDESGGVPFGAGDEVALVMLADANTPGDSITVAVLIAGTPVECDIDGGDAVTIKYNFEGKSAWVGAGAFANL